MTGMLSQVFTPSRPYALSVKPRRDKRTSAREIVVEVAQEAGLSPDDIYGDRKNHHISHPRQKVMHRLNKELRWSTPRIGAFLGDRDHTTILHGIRACENRMKEGEEW